MYDFLIRQTRCADDEIRPEAIGHHRGDRHDFLRRHHQVVQRALREGFTGTRKLAPYLLGLVADPRALRLAWDYLAREGGDAPGPNGMRYEDLQDHEIWSLCRCLGQAIRAEGYHPGPERVRWIPKGAGRGDRPLVIQNIEDRVVQRSIVEIIQPILDPLFEPFSLGYRPGKGRLHALAMAERFFLRDRRQTWVVEDIKDAFLQLPLARLLQIVQKYLPDDKLAQLIERVTHSGATRGLRQGGSLSPLLLNLYLHHFLDRPWKMHNASIPLLRVADDILLLCRSVKEARQAHKHLEGILTPAGMPLKGNSAAGFRNLAKGEVVEWLGFAVCGAREQLRIRVGQRAWSRLAEKLALAHLMPDAPLRAVAIIEGWVSQMGPCYPSLDQEAYARLRSTAHELAFDEIPSRAQTRAGWQRAYARWCRLRQRQENEHRVLLQGLCSRTGPGSSARRNELRPPA